MIPLSPTPLRTALVGALLPTDPWAKWFRDVQALLGYANNNSRDVTPVFTGLTEVGTVGKTMRYVKDRNLVTVFLSLVPSGGGTVAAAALGTYLANLPYAVGRDAAGVLVNRTTLDVVGALWAKAGTLELYLPTVGATADALTGSITYFTEDA